MSEDQVCLCQRVCLSHKFALVSNCLQRRLTSLEVVSVYRCWRPKAKCKPWKPNCEKGKILQPWGIILCEALFFQRLFSNHEGRSLNLGMPMRGVAECQAVSYLSPFKKGMTSDCLQGIDNFQCSEGSWADKDQVVGTLHIEAWKD